MSYFKSSGNVVVVAVILALFAQIATSENAHAQDGDDLPVLTTAQLAEYQGSFEGRDIQLDGSALTYFREGMPNAIGLELIGEDHFGIMIPAGAQVQTHNNQPIPTFKFNRNEDGEVTSMSILHPSGELISEHPKTGDIKSAQEESTIQ